MFALSFVRALPSVCLLCSLSACSQDWGEGADASSNAESATLEDSGAAADASVDGPETNDDGALMATHADAEPAPSCGSTECQHGGTCGLSNGVARCSCPAGWSGSSCELDVDECKGAHGCPVAFACENLPGGYTCAGELADFPLPRTDSTRPASDFSVDATSKTTLDNVTGLRWQLAAGDTRVSYADAQQTCAALSTLGHHDWRLPSYIEQLTLVVGTSIRDRKVPYVTYADTWSRTPMPGSGSIAYFWDWHSELLGPSMQGQPLDAFVRCVRREVVKCVVPPSARFTVTDGAVYDACTKLTWEELPSATRLEGAAAASYCAGRTTHKLKWRLPTYLELISTTDVPRASDLRVGTATAFFTSAEQCFMSSTPVAQPEATPPVMRPLASMLSNGDLWQDGPPAGGCLVRCVADPAP